MEEINKEIIKAGKYKHWLEGFQLGVVVSALIIMVILAVI